MAGSSPLGADGSVSVVIVVSNAAVTSIILTAALVAVTPSFTALTLSLFSFSTLFSISQDFHFTPSIFSLPA